MTAKTPDKVLLLEVIGEAKRQKERFEALGSQMKHELDQLRMRYEQLCRKTSHDNESLKQAGSRIGYLENHGAALEAEMRLKDSVILGLKEELLETVQRLENSERDSLELVSHNNAHVNEIRLKDSVVGILKEELLEALIRIDDAARDMETGRKELEERSSRVMQLSTTLQVKEAELEKYRQDKTSRDEELRMQKERVKASQAEISNLIMALQKKETDQQTIRKRFDELKIEFEERGAELSRLNYEFEYLNKEISGVYNSATFRYFVSKVWSVNKVLKEFLDEPKQIKDRENVP
ncbi:MAG: hypothetical protein ABH879_07720 [archaeon]